MSRTPSKHADVSAMPTPSPAPTLLRQQQQATPPPQRVQLICTAGNTKQWRMRLADGGAEASWRFQETTGHTVGFSADLVVAESSSGTGCSESRGARGVAEVVPLPVILTTGTGSTAVDLCRRDAREVGQMCQP